MGPHKSMKLFVLLLIVLCIPAVISELNRFSTNDLKKMITEHDYHCNKSNCFSVSSITFKDECCKECSCDLDTCVARVNCCPHVLTTIPTVEESKAYRSEICKRPQYIPYDQASVSATQSYWMVEKCADDFKDADIRFLCEHAAAIIPTNFSLLLPVTELSMKMTYQNEYCAQCNNASKETLLVWDATVKCIDSSFMPGRLDTILEDILYTEDCNIIYVVPVKVMQTVGEPDTCRAAIQQCNVTGRWETYDSFIEAACHAYRAVFNYEYQNIFCYYCNEIEKLPNNCKDPNNAMNYISFSAILGIQKTDDKLEIGSVPKLTCPVKQVLDPFKNKCKDVVCLPPKTYSDGKCTNVVTTLYGVYLTVFVKATPVNISVSVQYLDILVNSLTAYMLDFTERVNATDSLDTMDTYYSLTGKTDDSSDIPSVSVDHLVINMEVYSKEFYAESSLPFLDGILEMDGSTDTLLLNAALGFESVDFTFELGRYHPVHVGLNGKLKHLTSEEGDIVSFHWTSSANVGFNEPGHQTNIITKTSQCPLVEVTEYTPTKRNGSLYLTELDASFPPNTFVVMDDRKDGETKTYVCIEEYISAGNQPNKPVERIKSGAESTLEILTFCCLMVSIVCLVLSLLTYSLFSSLRTQPGINNMGLIICLICAQSLYQFGIGQSKHVSEWGCILIGVLIHFLWLTAMFWMNVCSFHMFQVFRKLNRTSCNEKSIRLTVIYTVYCFVASGIFVAVNIVMSHVRSAGKDIGYGGKLCYISDFSMTLYTFVIPGAFLVAVNLVLFATVLVNIARLPNMKNNTAHSRNYFKIYTKLSSITGIAWLFAYLTYTDILLFEYLFVIFTAGQGVFIFISIIFNKRVFKLYAGLCESWKSTPESLSSVTELASSGNKTK